MFGLSKIRWCNRNSNLTCLWKTQRFRIIFVPPRNIQFLSPSKWFVLDIHAVAKFYGLTRIEYWILCPVCFPASPLSLCLLGPTEKPIKGWNLNKISAVFISNSYQTITSVKSIEFNDFTHFVARTWLLKKLIKTGPGLCF